MAKRETRIYSETTKRILAAGMASLIFLTCGCAVKEEVSGAESKSSSSFSSTASNPVSSELESSLVSEVYSSKVESSKESSAITSSKVESSTPSKEYTSTPEKDRAKVLPYMAGGEYTNDTDTSINALTDKFCGATVVFSGNTEPLTQDVLNNSVISKIRGNLKSTDVVYVWNGEAYVFNKDNLQAGYRKITKYGQDGSKSIVENTNQSSSYSLKIVWNKEGICLSDGTRVTYQLSDGTYEQLNIPIMLGTEEQRIGHELKLLLNEVFLDKKNILNLDSNEVDKYISTGSDEGLKSFQVIKSQKAAFIAITGGEWGLNGKYIENLKECIARFDEIDPNIMKDLVEIRGLQVLTYDVDGVDYFTRHPTWRSTYGSSYLGRIIFVNQDKYQNYLQYGTEYMFTIMMFDIWAESEGLFLRDNEFLPLEEIEKNNWMLEQITKYQSQLTPEQIFLLSDIAKHNIEIYSNQK